LPIKEIGGSFSERKGHLTNFDTAIACPNYQSVWGVDEFAKQTAKMGLIGTGRARKKSAILKTETSLIFQFNLDRKKCLYDW
jgi:Holliday junction resolvasome RuvABC endonuclease subunit